MISFPSPLELLFFFSLFLLPLLSLPFLPLPLPFSSCCSPAAPLLPLYLFLPCIFPTASPFSFPLSAPPCSPCRLSAPPLPGPVAPPPRPARLNGVSHHAASSFHPLIPQCPSLAVTPHRRPDNFLGVDYLAGGRVYGAAPYSSRCTDARSPPSATYIPIRGERRRGTAFLQHPVRTARG